MSAIRSGSPGPASLQKFRLEHQLYQRLGMKLDDLLDRPVQEVHDYIMFIEMICREENYQASQAGRKGGPRGATR
jgi:hypothetical protein